MFSDFFSLIYPRLCAGCGKSLLKSEKAICLECIYEFAPIPISQIDNNPVAKVFWGRVNFEFAVSKYAFSKGHRVQKVLHALKYEGNITAGETLGELLGQQLKDLSIDIDVIVPLPLHPRRQKERGYNQAEIIAKGVQNIFKVPLELNAVKRVHYSKTQTDKNRIDRWDNVETVFELNTKDVLLDQKVLLVDDVLTTGATLDACAQVMLKGPVKSIGVATVACVI